MIPKVIHYCWFGRGEKPELAVRCIESWKEMCPEYQILEWNEDRFDINSNSYVKEAYAAKKYAFVADYVRLYALYSFGGIYMDTDVRVIKPLDMFLENNAFMGFENQEYVQTGLMASEKHHKAFEELLSYYDNISFVNEDGSLNLKTNVQTVTEYFKKWGLVFENKLAVANNITVYPKKVFCPNLKKIDDSTYMEDVHVIHYFDGSWKSEKTKQRENSWWWKYLIIPLSNVSKRIEKILGKPYVKLKNCVRDKIISEKQGEV